MTHNTSSEESWKDKGIITMGTERELEHECPCICGKGKFRIDFCNKDHGWPVSTPFWYEFDIQCKSCSQLYKLEQQDNSIVIVEKKEIEKRQQLAEEYYKRWQKLRMTSAVQKIIIDFVSILEQQPSMAAIHRLLSREGLESSSISAFRRNWRGANKWVESNIYFSKLKTIMKLVNNEDEIILKELDEIENIYKDSRVSLTPFGNPIYKISRAG